MELTHYTCCFTGHRALGGEARDRLTPALDRELRRLVAAGIHTFAAGGALGFDTLAAERVLHLRREFCSVRLVVVAPCADQPAGWRRADALRYERIREQADDYICLSAAYSPGCMSRRNRYLVEMSDVCLGYCLRKPSGTAQTMQLARRRGLQVINLAGLPEFAP